MLKMLTVQFVLYHEERKIIDPKEVMAPWLEGLGLRLKQLCLNVWHELGKEFCVVDTQELPFLPVARLGSIKVHLKPPFLVKLSNAELSCLHLLKKTFPERLNIQKYTKNETGEASLST